MIGDYYSRGTVSWKYVIEKKSERPEWSNYIVGLLTGREEKIDHRLRT